MQYQVDKDEFIIKDYNNVKPFASFFPAIAGLWGKPMWLFYVNRAQAVACMGTKDKNGAIMEFQAANKAYRLTSLQGFRTFIKTQNIFYEPFRNTKEVLKGDIEQRMHITPYLLRLTEINKRFGFEVSVDYFTIPNEDIPALARILLIKNLSNKDKHIECIDGLPIIVPYGTNDSLLKNMSRVAEGWFSGTLFTKKNKIPVYKLMVEPEDRPEVIGVEGGNFYVGFYYSQDNKLLFPKFIVDADVVFGEMKDFVLPIEFINNSNFINLTNTSAGNKTPSAMGYFKITIKSNSVFKYFSVIGNVQRVSDVEVFLKRLTRKDYLYNKQQENKNIIRSIGSKMLTVSSSNEFNNYCQQTYLDNLLRGGYPVTLGLGNNRKNYYVYSRLHGDMEREYNNFVILPEYFSQGNGNYRDVNQNRRNDVFFNQEIKDETLIYFINLIQTDGFNPLRIMGSKFKVKDKREILAMFDEKDKGKINKFISSPFSLGSFFSFLEKEGIKISINRKRLLDKLIGASKKIDYAAPVTGYWSDHWHYNIDLIESFLSIYPEELETVLLKKKVFTFFDNPLVVLPREEKYVLYNNKPRQINAVYLNQEKKRMIEARKDNKDVVRTNYGRGSVYKTTLMGKLLCLVCNKYASFDMEGVGIEMESDRPNWCDGLNGLPGLFGSSTAESLELKRLIIFILNSLDKLNVDNKREIKTAKEIIDFLMRLESITLNYSNNKYLFWDETHTVKERYRQRTMFGLSGEEKAITSKRLREILGLFLGKINIGIDKAYDKNTGVINTYFENEVVEYQVIKRKGKVKKNLAGFTCIKVLKFKQRPLPLFLEGPVHYLRTNNDKEEARRIHSKIIKSSLYDKKLKMFKINASLKGESMDLGRIRIFTPGWLENESIWLHMEYKYLLELLKNDLADEFYKIMKETLVPFMDPSVYGRSIFENVSFITSSAHPERRFHGQGFVARLSGSTAEFISMWISITSGLKPFYLDNNRLYLVLKPQIASWMFTTKKRKIEIYYNDSETERITVPENSFLFRFLGRVIVVYHNPLRKNTYGKGGAKVSKIRVIYFNGKEFEMDETIIPPPYSYDVRTGKVKRIEVVLK